jgi:hypothetical protein
VGSGQAGSRNQALHPRAGAPERPRGRLLLAASRMGGVPIVTTGGSGGGAGFRDGGEGEVAVPFPAPAVQLREPELQLQGACFHLIFSILFPSNRVCGVETADSMWNCAGWFLLSNTRDVSFLGSAVCVRSP